jgi:exodeoxyribonuclease VII large subunit
VSSLFDLPFEEPSSAEAAEGRPEPADATSGKPQPAEATAREPEPARATQGKPKPVDAPVAGPAARRILTVSEVTARIRMFLEREFFEVWIEGELSNCKVWNAGHMYFTLKDGGAQIKGVMFRSSLARLRFKPQDGLHVVARAKITVYDPKGEYQIICEHLEPEGLGALQLAFDQLKERLSKEGLFDQRRKRALPALPRKIGVVTSLDGAAIRDIIKVLRRRYANAHIVIRPARVQGDGAAMDVARGIRAIGKVPGVDVVIVGRGGGSIEDLWAFNEEVVARAIAGCPVPTISAVGHETDVTIADFVADVRAPTPSAAAEMVVSRKDDFCSRIDRLTHRVGTAMTSRLHRAESRLRGLEARPGYAGTHGRVAMRARHAAELAHELRAAMIGRIAAHDRRWQTLRRNLDAFDLRRRLGSVRTRLVAVDGRLASGWTRRRHMADGRLRSTASRLESLSPLRVLGRGYAAAFAADGNVLRNAVDVSIGDQIAVRLERGTLDCRVERIDGGTASEDTES